MTWLLHAVLAAVPPGHVGTEGCAACHEDIAKNLAHVRHGAIDRGAGRWKGLACESCHGPGEKHAEGADPKLIQNAPHDGSCQACHKVKQHGPHTVGKVACVSCHSVHKPGPAVRTATSTNRLCASCHTDAWASFQRPHAHALTRGAMKCTDCHDPHGTARANSVRDPGCVRCHNDKRGPFMFEHAPVRLEGCQTCHEPHGSANPRMLVRARAADHCLECHANLPARTNPSGTLGTVAPSFHDIRQARFQNCTTCHVKIHGSHVNRDFLR